MQRHRSQQFSSSNNTLQLRHQLTCNHVTVSAATYDPSRHHVILFDQRMWQIRVFSLKREIRSVRLFDESNELFWTKTVDVVQLFFSQRDDLILVVYGGESSAGSPSSPSSSSPPAVASPMLPVASTGNAKHHLLVLEPLTMRKLVTYSGAACHTLLCAAFDQVLGRLVVGSTVLNSKRSSLDMLRQLKPPRESFVEVVQVFMRPCTSASASSCAGSTAATEASGGAGRAKRNVLCVEKWFSFGSLDDLLTHLAISQGSSQIFASATSSVTSCQDTVLFQWSEPTSASAEKYLLKTKTLVPDTILSLSASNDNKWLFTGHKSGKVTVWNCEGTLQVFFLCQVSDTNGINSIILTQSSQDNDEILLFTTESRSGMIKHWRFACAVSSLSTRKDEEEQIFTSIGEYKASARETPTSNPPLNKPNQKETTRCVESNARVFGFFVSLVVGGFNEMLFVAVRRDLVHVLKVQCVMDTLLAFHTGQCLKVMRHVASSDQVVCLGSDVSNYAFTWSLSSQLPVLTTSLPVHVIEPQAFISCLECVPCSQAECQALILIGWSHGIVEIVALTPGNQRLAMLQEPKVNSRISCMTLFEQTPVEQPAVESKDDSVKVLAQDEALLATTKSTPMPKLNAVHSIHKPARRSEAGHKALLASIKTFIPDDTEDATIRDEPDAQEDSRMNVVVYAGTSEGSLISWTLSLPCLQSKRWTCQYILEAQCQFKAAHSTHVVQLDKFYRAGDQSWLMVSLGAEGMVKLWQLKPLQLVSFLNTTSVNRVASPCCMRILELPRANAPGDRSVMCGIGFDDGQVNVWRVTMNPDDPDHFDFQELHVTSRHDHTVSTIVQLGSMNGMSPFQAHFATCSVDGNVLLWGVTAADPSQNGAHDVVVEEKKYFEVGEPLLDMFEVGGTLVVALPHEIRRFRWSSKVVEPARSVQEPSKQQQDQPLGSALCPESTPLISVSESTENDALPPPLDICEHAKPHSSATDALFTPTTPLTILPAGGASRESSSAAGFSGWTENDMHHQEVLMGLLQQFVVNTGGANRWITVDDMVRFVELYFPQIAQIPTDGATPVHKYLELHRLATTSQLDVKQAATILRFIQDEYKVSFSLSHSKTSPSSRSTKSSKSSKSSRSPKSHFKMTAETDIQVPQTFSLSRIRRHPRDHQREKQPKLKAVVTYNLLGEKKIEWVAIETPDQAQTKANHMMHSSKNCKQRSSVAKLIKATKCELPDADLLGALVLPIEFRHLWSSQSECWCTPVRLSVQWDATKDVDHQAMEAIKCETCHKPKHVVHLTRHGYTPVFSLRRCVSLVQKTYQQLTAPSFAFLFKNAAKDNDGVPSKVIHEVVYNLFCAKFGMRQAAEAKLKLFFVGLCQFVGEFDCLSVFGELLGLFLDTSHHETVSKHMTALTVCCYSWFFARNMVVHGEVLVGAQPSQPQPSVPIILHPRSAAAATTTTSTTVRPHPMEESKQICFGFARLSAAITCAQELLVYPLVAPQFLANVVSLSREFAQVAPTRPSNLWAPTDPLEQPQPNGADASTQFIELHRFLRVLVSEWKSQKEQLLLTSNFLFVQPLRVTRQSQMVHKLHVWLCCLCFFDAKRTGMMPIDSFVQLMARLRPLLWHSNDMPVAPEDQDQELAEFDRVMQTLVQRFADARREEIGYLDIWALLYVVSLGQPPGTTELLPLELLPDFCYEFKLELSDEMKLFVVQFMKTISLVVLPSNLLSITSLVEASTVATTQHCKRVGGLHDGLLHLHQTQREPLASNDLLTPPAIGVQLAVDGTTPALQRGFSCTAMDRFGPVVVDTSHMVQPSARALSSQSSRRVSLRMASLELARKQAEKLTLMQLQQMQSPSQQVPSSMPKTSKSTEKLEEVAAGPQTCASGEPAVAQEEAVHPRQVLDQPPPPPPSMSPITASMVDPVASVSTPPSSAPVPPAIEVRDVTSAGSDRASCASTLPALASTGSLRRILVENYPTLQADQDERIEWCEEFKEALEEQEEEAHRALERLKASQRAARAAARARLLQQKKRHPRLQDTNPLGRASFVQRKKAAPTTRFKSQSHRASVMEMRSSALAIASSGERVHEKVSSREGDQRKIKKATSPMKLNQAALDKSMSIKERLMDIEQGQTDQDGDDLDEDQEDLDQEEGGAGDEEEDEEEGEEDSAAVAQEDGRLADEMPTGQHQQDEDNEGCLASGSQEQEPGDSTNEQEQGDNWTSADVEEDQNASNDLLEATESTHAAHAAPSTEQSHKAPVWRDSPLEELHSIEVETSDNIEAIASPDVAPVEAPVEADEGQSVVARVSTGPRYEDAPADLFDRTPMLVSQLPVLTPETSLASAAAGNEPVRGVSSPTRARAGALRFSHPLDFRASARLCHVRRPRQWQVGDASDEEDDPADRENHQDDDADSSLDDLEDDDDDDEGHRMRKGSSSSPQDTLRRKQSVVSPMVRLNDDAERALYGEKAGNLLGEGIELSTELEHEMAAKWSAFFAQAEAKLFAPVRAQLEKKLEARRVDQELQQKLKRKLSLQQLRDQERFQAIATHDAQHQHKHKLSTTTTTTTTTLGAMAAVAKNFRKDRMDRESQTSPCQVIEGGESLAGHLKQRGVHVYRFACSRDQMGCILTVKLHVWQGEAELFMSIDTSVPCPSDFMWRSARSGCSRVPVDPMATAEKASSARAIVGDVDPGEKIVLYPSEMARLWRHRCRDDLQDSALAAPSTHLVFYMAVHGLQPDTKYSVGVMTSGQKIEPSQAMQTVQELIDRFNLLAKSFAPSAMATTSSSARGFVPAVVPVLDARKTTTTTTTSAAVAVAVAVAATQEATPPLDPRSPQEQSSSESDPHQSWQQQEKTTKDHGLGIDHHRQFLQRKLSRRKLRNFGMTGRPNVATSSHALRPTEMAVANEEEEEEDEEEEEEEEEDEEEKKKKKKKKKDPFDSEASTESFQLLLESISTKFLRDHQGSGSTFGTISPGQQWMQQFRDQDDDHDHDHDHDHDEPPQLRDPPNQTPWLEEKSTGNGNQRPLHALAPCGIAKQKPGANLRVLKNQPRPIYYSMSEFPLKK